VKFLAASGEDDGEKTSKHAVRGGEVAGLLATFGHKIALLGVSASNATNNARRSDRRGG